MKNIFLFAIVVLLNCSIVRAQPEISEIARLGRGTGDTLSWRPDGQILAVGGSAGVWLFDANYRQLWHHPAAPVRYVEFSRTGDYLAVSDGME